MARLYAAGSNARGQLGSGHCEDQHTFQPAIFAHEGEGAGQSPWLPAGASHILGLACGANHTLVLLNTHELWASGDSSRGQLAFSPSTNVFRKLWLDSSRRELDKRVYKLTSVAACWETSYVTFTTDDPALSDVVFSFGANDFGERGVGATSPAPAEPTLVDFEPAFLSSPWCIKVRELVAGLHHVLARLEVWAMQSSEPEMVVVGWGACRHGQLGALPTAPSKRRTRNSTRAAPQSTITKFDQPRIIATYSGEEKPIQLAAGSQHSLILHSTHRVTPLGSSRHGQLHIPKPLLEPATSPNAVQKIGSTWATSFFVTYRANRNPLMTWHIDSCGSSNHGQLGRPPSDTPFGPIASLIMGGPLDFVQFVCGSEHVLLHGSDGVWGWGWNEHGNLGLGHTEDVRDPVVVWESLDREKVGDGKNVLGVWAGYGTSWLLVEKAIQPPLGSEGLGGRDKEESRTD
ncbi:hypothetical protein FRC10_005028 [Ceratobasidium sp. 414]|nr:hypothetical protein FRC10_005028 [Ceratobasidium sp. 414]